MILRITFMAFITALSLSSFSLAAQPQTSPDARLLSDPGNLAWGPTVNGLALSMDLPKSHYSQGEPIVVHESIRNTSAQLIKIRNTIIVSTILRDASGAELRPIASHDPIDEYSLSIDALGHITELTLPRGYVLHHEENIGKVYAPAPGRYTIQGTCDKSFFDAKGHKIRVHLSSQPIEFVVDFSPASVSSRIPAVRVTHVDSVEALSLHSILP